VARNTRVTENTKSMEARMRKKCNKQLLGHSSGYNMAKDCRLLGIALAWKSLRTKLELKCCWIIEDFNMS
jgi:hypothetical protein